ncbi:MAG: DUF4350 domain-containing protein [Bacteroidia bacterium]
MRKITYIFFVALLASGCQKEKVDWRRDFESQHKNPFGTSILLNELEYLFDDPYVEVIKGSTQESLDEWAEEYSTYLYINPIFYPDDILFERLLEYNEDENSVFISTYDSPNSAFDYFGIETSGIEDSLYRLTLTHLNEPDRTFTIENKRNSDIVYFTKIPDYARILGTIEIDDTSYPNFFSLSREDGQSQLFFHANPELFSNYHLLKDEDGIYALNTFSHLQHTEFFLWDGFGTERRYSMPPSEGDSAGLLRYILANKSLFFALILLMAALILFVVFNYKRVTRSMAVHLPPENNSIEFMTLVANLFVSEENHVDLARYRVNYVLDRIKEKYYLDIAEVDDSFRERLAAKANLNPDDLKTALYHINKVKNTNYLNKESFLKFNKIIEPFISKLSL